MAILHVIVRDPKAEEILFSEYVEIPESESPSTLIQAALAAGFLSHGIKRGMSEGIEMTRENLIRMYLDEKKSTIAIAVDLGVSPGVIQRFLKRNGVTMRAPGKHPPDLSPELIAQIVSLYVDKKWAVKAVCDETGLTDHQVRRILRIEKVDMRIGRPARG